MGWVELFAELRSFTIFAVCVMLAGATCSPRLSSQKEKGGTMSKEEKGAAVVYVALGDSTGVGVGAKKGGYVARLFTRIKSARPRSSLTNLCVSGAETEDVLRGQIRPALAARPTLLTLGIGINDVGHGVAVESFARNYEEIITRLKAETSAPIVITNIPDVSLAPVVSPYLRGEVSRRVNLFNERIREIAARHGLTVFDAYAATHEVIPSHPEFFSDDGFHPSDAGYEHWAETMWPTVKAAIDKQ